MIVRTTPSYIRLEVDGKRITVQGEAAGLADGQQPYFVAYANSIERWDPPNEQEKLSPETINKVIDVLRQDCETRKFPLVIE